MEMQHLNVLNWITFADTNLSDENIEESIKYLEDVLSHRLFLVGDSISDADCHVFMSLSRNNEFVTKLNQNSLSCNISRYYNFLKSLDTVNLYMLKSEKQNGIKKDFKSENLSSNRVVRNEKSEKSSSNVKFEEGGKFIGLKDAVEGSVVVRFPPEASGFLHIGHAKAALINQHYKDHYKGKLIMRFDDTNPAKESSEFENVILQDVNRLGINYDILSYSSNYFDILITYCEQLICADKAYADNTDPEIMKKEREQMKDSKCRLQSIEDNLKIWNEMKIGSQIGKTCCIRLKLDMKSKNGCMRDPTIYRCKAESHVRTGDKYKVYPTYDFACPIVDSIEGVTHSLRTSEYNDRNEQFYTILDFLSLRKPHIADYSRLSLQNTVLSKRKLTWIVDNGYVDGWDDPRMPTVRGILRHGMTVEGLKEFVIAQGFGRANVVMEWDKIWAFNKKVIDPIAPRYTCLSASANNLVQVFVRDQLETLHGEVSLHPKNSDIGTKDVWFTHTVLVERSDVDDFAIGTNVTFINWGNLLIENIEKDIDGKPIRVVASLNLEDRDFKKTLKVTWLPIGQNDDINIYTIPLSIITYSDLITKNVLEKDDDFKDFMNPKSRTEDCLIGDVQMCKLKKGDIIQIQRKGYFVCDEPYIKKCDTTGREYPLVLINIPEGNKKERVTTGLKQKDIKSQLSDSVNNKDLKAEIKVGIKCVNKNISDKKETIPKERLISIETKGQLSESVNVTDVSVINVEKEVEKHVNESKEGFTSIETKEREVKKQTRLIVEATKEDNFSEWYRQVITKSEFLGYYDISGCYIYLPGSYFIWENIQAYVNTKIEMMEVENCYFPLFISEESLNKEKDHIADFTPEVAWVTECGNDKMEKRIAIRPTSETSMYPYYANKIKSHNDLPLKFNQWCNVVRWEFKNPVPFLRSREFLWQEGHTAYANQEDAIKEVHDILDLYADVYENLLAIPVVKGRKTEKEKFAGADFTTTTEIYIPTNGRAIQGATSHHLGQNFSKMFDITYQSDSGKLEHVYQNSWGMTTRTIGVMVMVHGDNVGLVLPPKVAKIQVVIVPCGITVKTSNEVKKSLLDKCAQVKKCLCEARIRCKADIRDTHTPGWKFNHWEQKGVPIRIEIGPRDISQSKVVLCYRYNGVKESVSDENLDILIGQKFSDIHNAMYTRAKNCLDAHRMVTYSMSELCQGIDNKMMVTAPFCGDKNCEERIKQVSARDAAVEEGAPSMGAKSLCIPFDEQDGSALGLRCVNDECTKLPQFMTMFGRSY